MLSDLSLHILDIARNSLDANAAFIEINIVENGHTVELEITDNGDGMPEKILENAVECGFSTKNSGGFGLYILKEAALKSGGRFNVTSKYHEMFPNDHGTSIKVSFNDLPLGNITETILAIISSAPTVDILVTHISTKLNVRFDTREVRRIIKDIPLNSPEILNWVKKEFDAQYTL